MSDIFQEVDEEVRREQLKKLWDRHQNLVFVAIFLILVGVAGWQGYQYWQNKQAAETGAAFEAAQSLSDEGKHAEAATAFGKIAAEGPRIYRNLARMREAAEIAQTDAKAAIAAYGKIADDRSVPQDLQDLAALRAGSLLIDQESFNDAKSRLEPVAGAGRPYRVTARELLAFGAWRAGDVAAAKRWAEMLSADLQTPQATRSRVEILLALVGTAGDS